MKKALYAGILIGIGVIVNASVDNRYFGAMLFSLGLLTIIKCEMHLYTGKIGFIGAFTPVQLAAMLAWNFVGVLAVTLICAAAKPEFLQALQESAKFEKPVYAYLFLGILCGICMYVAVSSKSEVITVFAIMVFILSGFEHCIADFPFLVFHLSVLNIVRFLLIIAGNSIGAMAMHLLKTEKTA